MGADYLIVCPEKCSFWKLFLSVIFPHVFKPCVIDRPDSIGFHLEGKWRMKLSLLFIKIVKFGARPLKAMGNIIEFLLNLLYRNGGLLRTLFKLLTRKQIEKHKYPKDDQDEQTKRENVYAGSINIPKRKSDTFLSFVGLLVESSDLYNSGPQDEPRMNPGDRYFAKISILASTIAYENPLLIENTVNQRWKMHFVKFFDCWNDYLKKDSTKAFILCDKKEDAKLVVIAFRGTGPFESDDYITDVDFSWYESPQMGKVHLGFLEALGLKNRSNFSKDKQFSCNLDPDKDNHSLRGAYNKIHEKLKDLLQAHKNAKFIVTGHSLGGALAVLFTAMLFLNEEKSLENLLAVYTFGQPRVGNKIFADFMNKNLNENRDTPRYFRVVYSNDIIPRLPFEDDVFKYMDFGACIYYNSLYSEKNLAETPNRNFSPVFFIPIKLTALWELLQCLVLHYRKGKEFKETKVSIFCRMLGVLSPGLLIPGLSAHSPVNYIHAVRLGPKILNPNLGVVEN